MIHPTSHLVLGLVITLFLDLASSPVSARKGPHPSDVTPSSYASSEYAAMQVPMALNAEGCTPNERPRLNNVYLSNAVFDRNALSIFFAFTWCASGPVRLRVLRLSGTRKAPLTHVINSEISDNVSVDFGYLADTCEDYKAYVEVCGRLPSMGCNARPLCVTSRAVLALYAYVPTPRLSFRPPIKLELAPGDKAKIVHRIVKATERGPLGNGGYDTGKNNIGNVSYVVGSSIKSQHGRVLKKPMLKRGKVSSVVITKFDSSYLSRKFYNGAKARMVFARSHCPKNIRTLDDRYATSITVHKRIRPLVKQDVRLPTFKQPKFKPVKSGSSATITVKARNNGGGMRKGGMPTKLHFQWYLRTLDYAEGPTYAEPIKGATSPTLQIQEVTCEMPDYSRYEVSGLKEYYVDVCNTFGCKRSGKIVPRYIAEDGSIFTDHTCV